MSATTVLALSIDCADAATLASFWSQVLGRPVNDGATAEFAAIAATDATATGPLLLFHQVPEGKNVKNRLHLDLVNADFEAETQRLLGLGATRLNDVDKGDARWRTLADPEGNEFDLVAG
ncbi:VOC family protein [Streptomyces sp. NPDC093228]|uniref:VOC family protein n=1 Tax=Streptomyces sp. NPDC093228 TaxID=3155070 RepID=UPI0034275F3B